MVTFFIWLGVIGGILVASSIAGYRIYTGKITKERENNSIIQREKIKDKIIESKNSLSKQIDKTDTIILSKLDDVGDTVNKIYNSDESNIKHITFPDNGDFGKNILNENLTEIRSGTYSMHTILPKNQKMKVKVSGSNWSFSAFQAMDGWDYSNLDNTDTSRVFRTVKYGRIDLKMSLEKGETKVALYIGNSEMPEWIKIISIN